MTLISWITSVDLLWWREQTPPETWVRTPMIAERLSCFTGISRSTIAPHYKQCTPMVTVELTADVIDGISTAPLPSLEWWLPQIWRACLWMADCLGHTVMSCELGFETSTNKRP